MKKCLRNDPRPPAIAGRDSARASRERAARTNKDQPPPPPEDLAGVPAHEMQRVIHELHVHQIEVEAQNDEMQRVIHELHVHQIELEAQNEELQRQHAELAAAAARNAELQESLHIKSLAFDLAINAISIANPEGIITQANAAFLRVWGYSSAEEVVGIPIPHFLQEPKDAAAIFTVLDEAGLWEGSYAAKRRDGSFFTAHGLATVMRDELGQVIGYQSSMLDITERLQLEVELENNRRMFAEAERIGKVGGWEFDIDTSRQTWTAEIHRIFELDLTYAPSVDDGIAFYTPESRPVITLAVQRAIELGEPYDLELEVITAKGNRKWVHAIGRADLAHRRIYGFFQDITSRKRVEEALRESEARYREIFELAADGILQGSPGGGIIGANTQMQKLAGRSLDELLGQHVSVLFGPEELAAVPLRFDLLNREWPLIPERNLLRPDGSRVPVEMHSKMMPDGTYQTIYRDITMRRQAEAALENSHRLRAEVEQIGKVGGWELDLAANRLRWTEEIHRIVEVDHAYEPTVNDGTAFYTPASKPVIALAVRRAIELGEPYDLELEIITAKGNLKSVHTIGRPDLAHHRLYGFFQDITERKQGEQALRELHEVFDSFMRHSPIYSYIELVTPTESRVLHASDNYEQMLGRPLAEILDQSTTDLFPAEQAARLHAVDWQVATTGETIRIEEEVNGRIYAAIKFPIVQGSRTLVAGYTIDITEQKQAELTLREWNQTLERRVAERTQELQQSKARFRQLAETTFEGIAISQGGKLIDANTRLDEMHGYELAEMIGQPVADFVAPESRAKVAANIRLAHEGTYEFLALRKDGTTFPAEAHGRMGSWRGAPARITALRDLTENKRLAARLLTQQTALEHAQRLALMSEVCAGIVHQISQPLCAMGANLAVIQTRLAAAPETCGETLEILREIIDSVACIRNVMHHMRALLPTEQPNHLPTDIHRLLAETLPLLRQEAEHRGIRLTVELGSDLPAVLADEVQLNQVVLNLTRNAFDACTACPPDRRLVTITTRAVGDTTMELSVRDTGAGIAHEVIDHLFAPFFTTKAGMGIGLRLSRTIVEAHGGSIEASNNADGIGATFRVTLPSLPQLSDAVGPA